MIYKPRTGAHLPAGVDYQSIGETIARLREDAGGGFTPALVVEEARAEDSPLHRAGFTWDAEAGYQKNLENEARYLIRSIVVVYEDESRVQHEARAFVSVTERETEEDRYMSFVTAMADEEYRAQIVARALDEAMSWRRKYEDVKEFARIFAAIDRTAATRHMKAVTTKAA